MASSHGRETPRRKAGRVARGPHCSFRLQAAETAACWSGSATIRPQVHASSSQPNSRPSRLESLYRWPKPLCRSSRKHHANGPNALHKLGAKNPIRHRRSGRVGRRGLPNMSSPRPKRRRTAFFTTPQNPINRLTAADIGRRTPAEDYRLPPR